MTKDRIIGEYLKEIGRKGGTKRGKTLTPEQRTEIARMGGVARWQKTKRAKKPR